MLTHLSLIIQLEDIDFPNTFAGMHYVGRREEPATAMESHDTIDALTFSPKTKDRQWNWLEHMCETTKTICRAVVLYE